MTTTAFDDQYLAAPELELVREHMSREAILRRNVAALEVALRQQTELKEKAEAELAKLREQKPHEIALGKGEIVIWPIRHDGVHGLAFVKADNPKAVGTSHAEPDEGYVELGAGDSAIYFGNAESAAVLADRLQHVISLMNPANADPAPAPAVPAEWRKVMAELAADLQAACDAEHPHRDQYPSVMRKYNNDMKIVEKARSLLQSADHSERNLEMVAPDCRTCANRGRINGLSQESYCDSCVYEGRGWRQNHFADASKMVAASEEENEH